MGNLFRTSFRQEKMILHVFYVQFTFLYADLLIKLWGVEHLAEMPESSASGRSDSPDKITLLKKVQCVSSESELSGNLEFFLNSATSQLCYLDHITLKWENFT